MWTESITTVHFNRETSRIEPEACKLRESKAESNRHERSFLPDKPGQ